MNDPELSPTLRAGLGGLAASLLALERLPEQSRPPGTWTVEKDRVILDWKVPGEAGPFLRALFEASFRIRAPHGLIDLPGAWDAPPVELHALLQDAIRRTVLQHGRTAKKAGEAVPYRFELDGRIHGVAIRPHLSFVHQTAWTKIARALDAAPGGGTRLGLAAWAMPGAVERHVGLGATQWEYTAEQALCGCFALVGSVSYLGPGGGVLVVPEPRDLRAFARARPALTPARLREVVAAGPADAALTTWQALSRQGPAAAGSVGRLAAFTFRSTAWSSQQKSRVEQVEAGRPTAEALSVLATLADALPARLVDVGAGGGGPPRLLVVPSPLRALVADNLLARRPWYAGFASARDPFERERFVHYHRAKDNRGALRHEERGALGMLLETLDDAERVLVESVQRALRRRLGAIAEEKRGSPVTMRRRWDYERERWRLAFAGAKTLDQTRHALADMWSRAGNLTELHEGWPLVLQLLTPERWQAARDLALIALASYQGRGPAPALEHEAA